MLVPPDAHDLSLEPLPSLMAIAALRPNGRYSYFTAVANGSTSPCARGRRWWWLVTGGAPDALCRRRCQSRWHYGWGAVEVVVLREPTYLEVVIWDASTDRALPRRIRQKCETT